MIGNGASYEVQYYLRDHLGNVRMVMNEAGTIVQETEYFPFGLAIPRSGTDGVNRYQFLNKEKQPETAWTDLQARFYDPTTGRFFNIDPETDGQVDFSPYHYSFDNPMRFSDPDGRWAGENLWKGIKNWLNKPISRNAQVVGRGAMISGTGMDVTPQTRGELGIAIAGHVGRAVGGSRPGSFRFPNTKSTTSKTISPGESRKAVNGVHETKPALSSVPQGGAARAAKYSSEWPSAKLQDAVAKFAPGSEGVVTGQKTLYQNSETGIQVVADNSGNYFRIQDTNVSGKRQYLDMNGNIPNNKVVNGKQMGRNQEEYNQVTHFNNIED